MNALVEPLAKREASREFIDSVFEQIKLIKPADADAVVLSPADASNRMSYQGIIHAITGDYALQQIGKTQNFVIHDLQLLPSTRLRKGSDVNLTYAYDKGKIVQHNKDLER